MSESSNQPGVAVEPAYLKPPNAPPLPPDPAVNIEIGSGIDAPDDSTPVAEETAGVAPVIPGSTTGLLDLALVIDEKGVPYAAFKKKGRTFVLRILGKKFAKYVRAELARRGTIPRKNEVQELIEQLAAMAESAGQIVQVWYRVAPIEGGCVLDMGDPDHTRIRVTAEGVQVLPGCPIHFMRTGTCLSYTRPAEVGNRKLLDKYLNLCRRADCESADASAAGRKENRSANPGPADGCPEWTYSGDCPWLVTAESRARLGHRRSRCRDHLGIAAAVCRVG